MCVTDLFWNSCSSSVVSDMLSRLSKYAEECFIFLFWLWNPVTVIQGKTSKQTKKFSGTRAEMIRSNIRFTCNTYSLYDMSRDGYSLQSIPCDLLLHINCSIRAPARRVFYGAVKLGSFYGSNSMNHYCFFHLILIKRFTIAKLVHISIHTHTQRRVACIFWRCSFYLWEWGSLAEHFEVDYTLFTTIIEFWQMFKATRLHIKAPSLLG